MALTIPNTFVNGTPAVATEVNANFTAVKAEVDLKVDSTLVDAKGDLIVATAADTVARQAVGSNGQVLVADSGVTNGVAWVDPQSNRNVIINGAMQVAQRGTSTASITSSFGYFTADRWHIGASNLGTWTQSVEADAPTGSGFRNSLKMLCTTADASPAAGDFLFIGQKLEGQNVQQFLKGTSAAKGWAVSFWVKSNVTGTYTLTLQDEDNSRIVSANYSVSASGTWEKKTVSFPADTTGVLNNDNGKSIELYWGLGSGTDRTSGTLQTSWAAQATADFFVGQTNVAATLNNYWQVTGVQLEAGAVATPFEFEDISTTLAKCQRYYYRVQPASAGRLGPNGSFTSATNAYFVAQYPVTMRALPTSIEFSSLTAFDYATDISLTALTITAGGSTTTASLLTATVASGGTQFRPIHMAGAGGAGFYALSAEL